MADTTLDETDRGIFEQPITAGTEYTIAIAGAVHGFAGEVVVHSGASPVYVATKPIAPKDRAADMVMPGSALEIDVTYSNDLTVHLVSESDAVVSVMRR